MKRYDLVVFVVGLVFGFTGMMILMSTFVKGQTPPPPLQSNSVFGLTMDRFDYVISDVNVNGFSTTAPLRGTLILVFRNGLLLTVGSDYTMSPGMSGRTKVVFASGVLAVDDRVSLVYWR